MKDSWKHRIKNKQIHKLSHEKKLKLLDSFERSDKEKDEKEQDGYDENKYENNLREDDIISLNGIDIIYNK